MAAEEEWSRRRVLGALGAAAAALAAGCAGDDTPARDAATEPPTTPPAADPTSADPTSADPPDLALDEVQGNVLVGFRTDDQLFWWLTFPDPADARAWLSELSPMVTPCTEVIDVAGLTATIGDRRPSSYRAAGATWVNVAFTHEGLAALGVPNDDLDRFPDDFREGMDARAEQIGDVGDAAPSAWPAPHGDRPIHALLHLAATGAEDLQRLIPVQQSLLDRHGIGLLAVDQGQVRVDEPGHEHFGFKEGISQPGIRGVTPPSDPTQPDEGEPGQALLWPGEFLLGQPGEPGDLDGWAERRPGPIRTAGPAWAAAGSFLVFRRLAQDVAAFRAGVDDAAAASGSGPDAVAAHVVGRYPSGAPLAIVPGTRATSDPAAADPADVDTRVLDRGIVDDFRYDDPAERTPTTAHIRRVHPRAGDGDAGEADAQTHRLIRRSIPYGPSLPSGAADDGTPRGLLFLCYQSSIERQFEHVQRRMLGLGADPDEDSLMAAGPRPVHLPAGPVTLGRTFVTARGGAYLFQPSIPALRGLADP